MDIEKATKADYLVLIKLWELSVRASHHFLGEDDIAALRALMLDQYFDAADIRVAKSEMNTIIGFIGVTKQKVEMQFIAPDWRKKGIGSRLLKNAIKYQQARKVDVNEQNPDAVGFYQCLGFSITGRSPLDGQGNPFPLLHMELLN